MPVSTGMTIHVSTDAFFRATQEQKIAVDAASFRIVRDGALLIASDAKRHFRPRPGGQRVSKKSGRTYYVYTPPFQAIPPQPTSRSDGLQTSIGKVSSVTKISGGWMSIIGTKLSYAGYVEYGTRFMQPEPFMEYAATKNQEKIQLGAAEEWSKAMEV